MVRRTCDSCNRGVSLATGRENVWVLEGQSTEGLMIEVDDGTDYVLCSSCLQELPTDPTIEDVEQLIKDDDTSDA